MDITPEQKELLQRHLELLLEVNKTMNLTRITDEDEAWRLHVEDSLQALPEISEAPEGLYGDLGSGGGYPGIPVAVVTGRETVLVDSVKKKMAALDGIVEEMGLSDRVSTKACRIEDLAKERPEAFSLLTARALSSLPSLLELASPLLKKGGRFVCYKARLDDEELAAVHPNNPFGMKLVSDRSFSPDGGETLRRILVFEKVSKPKVKLPRRVGLAQHSPLCGNER